MARRTRTMGRIIDAGTDQDELFTPPVVSTEDHAAFSETERTRPKAKAKKNPAGPPGSPQSAETASPVRDATGGGSTAPGASQPVRRVPAGAWIAATLRRWADDTPDAPVVSVADVYPCRCDDDLDDDEFAKLPQVRRDAYRKEQIRPKRCNPWQKGGRWHSRCPCWGRRRDARLPEGCCAWMDPNPAYGDRWSALDAAASVVSRTGGTEAVLDVDLIADPVPDGDVSEAAYAALSVPEKAETRVDEVAGRPRGDARFYDALGLPIEVEAKPVTPSWSALDVACGCRTPWGSARSWSESEVERKGRGGVRGAGAKSGYHCPQCHRNFKSYALAEGHQRDWTQPCRDPAVIADFTTGRPLYRLSLDAESGAGVWGLAHT